MIQERHDEKLSSINGDYQLEHPQVFKKAGVIAAGETDKMIIAQKCYEWVRDQIQHCCDGPSGPVICSASEVLKGGRGIQNHFCLYFEITFG
ncbi:MAG: hypothetical protein KGJ09_08500 [Candidatus Omnitrophica bacterium]|nr:hypothetical protein [Candidatus Omnitrophota bacterium]MDE2214927.1 hypothetical protein [Candidatus Omnitrophota bacterium]MDE2232268.1 hypothetical protein [Candidatus Omnitrophota bacterium]